jgi:hypothetical protein
VTCITTAVKNFLLEVANPEQKIKKKNQKKSRNKENKKKGKEIQITEWRRNR